MPKSSSTKSAEPHRSVFKKPSRKQGHPVSQKTGARDTNSKASTASKKSSRQPQSPSVRNPRSTLKPLKGEIRKAADSAGSKTIDKRQEQMEKGRAVRQLFEKGYSPEKLARKFRCSKSLIRELIILGGLPKDLEVAYIERKADRKEVLKKARARKSSSVSTALLKPEAPLEVSGQNPQPETAVVVRTEAAWQNPPSQTTEEDRQEESSRYAHIIVEWLPQTGLRPSDYRTFFKQVDSALNGTRPWLFDNEAPKPGEIQPNGDPWKVINLCKVVGGSPQSAPDVTNNAVTWLARWLQRLIPGDELMKDTISEARALLLEQAL